ncbi:MAG TPA: Xaa-Pro peptidase family protein [Xanthobacteraceae bacterium]|nr:Xaa-Pro peptidase family protein [Xanthobacteraceae bacterium]
MSKHDFTAEEFASRLARARAAIGKAGLDWLLVIHPVSMRWLIGQDNKSYTAFQCLPVSAREGRLEVFTRDMERNEFESDSMAHSVWSYNGREPEDPMEAFARFADALGLKSSRVGMEVPAYYLHPQHYVKLKDMLGSALVAEPNGLINGLKVTKSPQELAYHRRSAAIAAEAWKALLSVAREGASELELSGAAYQKILALGSFLPASTMNLVTGERSCFALGGPTERKMQRHDTGLVELGGAYKRYTSTLGRQWSIGKPSARLIDLHKIVRDASDAAMAKMKAGAAAIEAHEALKGVIAKAGLDHCRQHTSGYGMAPGFPPSWGEPTNMFGGSKDVLQANMVMTIEPGVFIKEEGIGVRLIDNCIIKDDGIDLLSTTPRDIAVID